MQIVKEVKERLNGTHNSNTSYTPTVKIELIVALHKKASHLAQRRKKDVGRRMLPEMLWFLITLNYAMKQSTPLHTSTGSLFPGVLKLQDSGALIKQTEKFYPSR